MDFMEEKMKNEGMTLLVYRNEARRSVEYGSVHVKQREDLYSIMNSFLIFYIIVCSISIDPYTLQVPVSSRKKEAYRRDFFNKHEQALTYKRDIKHQQTSPLSLLKSVATKQLHISNLHIFTLSVILGIQFQLFRVKIRFVGQGSKSQKQKQKQQRKIYPSYCQANLEAELTTFRDYKQRQSNIIIPNQKRSPCPFPKILCGYLISQAHLRRRFAKNPSAIKMFHLDFYEDQENSLDILIKFRDEQQQPQSHTHQQCFLPLTEISVTSDHPSASPHLSAPTIPDQDIITEELIRKMQVACHSQEQKVKEIWKKMDKTKTSSLSVSMRKKRGESFQELDQQFPSKHKIIHKKKSE